jgi:hypothetical protein
MNYLEAAKAAKQWTEGITTDDEGWRGVMLLLLERIESMDKTNASLHSLLHKKTIEVESLSLDLGIKQQDFVTNDPKTSSF